jgi:hypothetical protein
MKLYSLLFLLIFIPRLSFCQADMGFKIAGGYHQLNGIKSNSDLGYEAGFFSKASLGEKVSLLLELDYSDKKSEVLVNDTSFELEMNFVNFRFSLGYDFNEHFFIAAGPSFSYMITPTQSPKLIPDSFFTHFALGIDPCVGFETQRFLFFLRYEYSLTVLTLEATPEAKGNVLEGTHWTGLKLGAGVKF